jgi:hypothetical protein
MCEERDGDFVVQGEALSVLQNNTRLLGSRVLCRRSTQRLLMNRVLLFALIILAALWALADIDTRSKSEARVRTTANGARG